MSLQVYRAFAHLLQHLTILDPLDFPSEPTVLRAFNAGKRAVKEGRRGTSAAKAAAPLTGDVSDIINSREEEEPQGAAVENRWREVHGLNAVLTGCILLSKIMKLPTTTVLKLDFA